MNPAEQLPRLAGQLVVALLAVSGLVALAVSALGAGHQARQLLGLSFAGPTRDPQAALEIAVTNLRIVGACLVAALGLRIRPGLRGVLDVLLGLLLASNALVLGGALGAYGDRVLAAVAVHGPLELAAFGLAGGAYVAARTSPLSLTALGLSAGVAVALVAVGAVVETYVEPGGVP